MLHPTVENGLASSYYILVELLQTLSTYAYLRKLHINSLTQHPKYWDTLLQILPTLKKLEVLHIEGSRPNTTEQFIAFTQILQTLHSLKKICIHTTKNEQEANALTKSCSTLKNLCILNLVPYSFH